MILEPKSLTEVEMLGLQSQYNFADGHAYHDLAPSQTAIINRLDKVWTESAALKVRDSETLYFEAFWQLAKSQSLKNYPHFRVCPTASNSIDIIGAWLAEKGMGAGLLHPTFDNLYLLLKRRGVKIEPVDESFLHEKGPDFLKKINADSIFLVNPNNPTGKTFSSSEFQGIVSTCVQTRKTLLLDNTFRFFVDPNFDQYKILLDSGVSFISIEDTGKVWPTQDMKASLMVYSKDIAKDLEIIYEEIYLCVSNFTLGILREFLIDANIRGLDKAVWKEVEQRRSILREALCDSPFSIAPTAIFSRLSVEWLQVGYPFANDLHAMDFFQSLDLTLLPGRKFFWSATHEPKNQQFVRISLLKPYRHFIAAVKTLQEGLDTAKKGDFNDPLISFGT